MTVIVVRDGVMASDSRVTVESEAGGIRHFHCQKLYKVRDVVIGVCGDGFAALRFVEWYRRGKSKPPQVRDDMLVHGEADFSALVLHASGRLLEYDQWLIPEEIHLPKYAPFYAVGCGAKAALGALYKGASAREAVVITCKIDPFCDLPVVTARPK